jgi:hypothetical protein
MRELHAALGEERRRLRISEANGMPKSLLDERKFSSSEVRNYPE